MRRFTRTLVTRCALAALSVGCVGELGEAGTKPDGDSDFSDVAAAPSELARLTRVEYRLTVTEIFGEELVAGVSFGDLPADGKVGRFESNIGLTVNIDSIDAYRAIAEQIGAATSPKAPALLGCTESDACVDEFLRDVGLRIYRRPLSAEQLGLYRKLWDTTRTEGTLGDAMRLVITAFLQSPDFLYRLENGVPNAEGNVLPLDSYELASRLSFFLWKSGPDKELLSAAASGELDTPDGLENQARRLLADPRSDYAILRFYKAWLSIDALETQLVDPAVFPDFEDLRDDMQAETDRFILHIFREDDAQIDTLFNANYSFASPELTSFYEQGVSNSTGEKVSLNPEQRAGILTQASFLTSHARTPSRAAIYRGKSLVVDVFCRNLVLPEDVNTSINFDPTLPARQQIEEATASPGCSACHSVINPFGFLFENYDGIGRWRTTEGEYPVNATATLVGTDVEGELTGATQLAPLLGKSDQVADCLSRQWLRFALSRPDAAGDEGSITDASDAAQGDMRELVIALTLSDAFRFRRLELE